MCVNKPDVLCYQDVPEQAEGAKHSGEGVAPEEGQPRGIVHLQRVAAVNWREKHSERPSEGKQPSCLS